MTELGAYEIAKKMMFYTTYLIVGLIILFGMIAIFRKYVQSPAETDPRIYVDTYLERFLSSPDCFAYKDPETNVTYSGVIDKAKFNTERLKGCFVSHDDSRIEFLFNLVDQGEEINIKTEEFGQAQRKTATFVLINDKGDIRRAELDIGVQT